MKKLTLKKLILDSLILILICVAFFGLAGMAYDSFQFYLSERDFIMPEVHNTYILEQFDNIECTLEYLPGRPGLHYVCEVNGSQCIVEYHDPEFKTDSYLVCEEK